MNKYDFIEKQNTMLCLDEGISIDSMINEIWKIRNKAVEDYQKLSRISFLNNFTYSSTKFVEYSDDTITVIFKDIKYNTKKIPYVRFDIYNSDRYLSYQYDEHFNKKAIDESLILDPLYVSKINEIVRDNQEYFSFISQKEINLLTSAEYKADIKVLSNNVDLLEIQIIGFNPQVLEGFKLDYKVIDNQICLDCDRSHADVYFNHDNIESLMFFSDNIKISNILLPFNFKKEKVKQLEY